MQAALKLIDHEPPPSKASWAGPSRPRASWLTADPIDADAWRRPVALRPKAGRLVSQDQQTWGSLSAVTRVLRCDGPFHSDFRADCTRLVIMLEEVGGYCEVRTEPNRSAPAASRHPNHMSLIPSGTTAWGHSDQISYMRDISLQFATTSIGAVLDNEADLERALTPRLMFSDPRLLNIGRLFAAECAAGEPCDALYGDSLTLALVVGLLRLDRTGGDTPARGGLAPWQLRRTVDCLEAHVARGVRLETLADLAQLSPSHFSRAFKTSTGVAPHRWLLQARVRKAQELLIEGRMPLAAVAVETGFVDQAHFTRVFSRATGESPGAWRRVRHG